MYVSTSQDRLHDGEGFHTPYKQRRFVPASPLLPPHHEEAKEAFALSSPSTRPQGNRSRSGSVASLDSAVSVRDRDRGFWSYIQSMMLGQKGSDGGGDMHEPLPLLATQRSSSSSSFSFSSSLSVSSSFSLPPAPAEREKPAQCQMCGEAFGLFRRPHRCRRCQGPFCLACSRHYIILPGAAELLGCVGSNLLACFGMRPPDAQLIVSCVHVRRNRRPQRVCDRCFVQTKDEHARKQQRSSEGKAHMYSAAEPPTLTRPTDPSLTHVYLY